MKKTTYSKVYDIREKFNLLKLQKLLICVVTILFFLGLTGFSAKCSDIENSVLRLHILANSDNVYDQELKLKVRDAVLSAGSEAFTGAKSADEAEQKIVMHKDKLLSVAKSVIEEEGYDYDVTLEITDEKFPTRTYDHVTLPAGTYRAVKIVIGEGEGHNWWCVMFPALCLPGASSDSLDAVLTEGEVDLVKTDPKLDVRFKITELFEKAGTVMDRLFS